jgi:hypothetical protein
MYDWRYSSARTAVHSSTGETVHAPAVGSFCSATAAKYDAWSNEHPDRLRRNDARWRYWNWHYRICEGFGDGYLCAEPNGLREGIWTPGDQPLPFTDGTEWFGTTLMADQLGFVFEKATVELYLMGHNVPGVPQMFLTDQF